MTSHPVHGRESAPPCLLDTVRNLLVTTPAKLGMPSGSGKGFNLRVVGVTGKKATFEPLQLYRRAKSLGGAYVANFEHLGFKFPAGLEFIIETHPGAVTVGKTPFHGAGWASQKMGHAFMAFDGSNLKLPGLVGRSKLNSNGQRVVFLGAVNEKQHALDFPLGVAHEIAHATEPLNSNPSLIWREARADFLGYLVSGESQVRMPAQVKAKSGSLTSGKVITTRDIAQPTVKTPDQGRASLTSYHKNSMIVSSLLHDLSQKLGRDEAVAFVKWMDALPPEHQVPMLLPLKERPKKGPLPRGVKFVDDRDSQVVGQEVLGNLHHIGSLMRHWAHEVRRLGKTERVWIDRELHTRGAL